LTVEVSAPALDKIENPVPAVIVYDNCPNVPPAAALDNMIRLFAVICGIDTDAAPATNTTLPGVNAF
jgi:hypothetical protein